MSKMKIKTKKLDIQKMLKDFEKRKYMKAVIAKDYGKSFSDTNGMLSVTDKWEIPNFSKTMKGRCLIKVSAVALAPGDCRVMSGDTREVQGPPKFPFVPGGDVSGIVLKVAENEKRLKVGDSVVAMFKVGPRGALGEYAIVHTAMTELKPKNISSVRASALGCTAVTAMVISKYIKKGDRVLVLGGAGGVGHILVQLCKYRGASFVASTSTQEKMLKSLGVDQVIDYRKENVWEKKEFKKKKFDVVIDLNEGGWEKAKECKIVKSRRNGGKFLTTVPDKSTFHIHSIWQMFWSFMYPIISHSVKSWFFRSLPHYNFVMGLTNDRKFMTDLFDIIEKENLNIVMDSGKHYEFTTEGVRLAYKKQGSRHAHGKVVIKISDHSEYEIREKEEEIVLEK